MRRPLLALIIVLLASCSSGGDEPATSTTRGTTPTTTIPVGDQIDAAIERAVADGVLCVDAFAPGDDLAFEPEHEELDSGAHVIAVVCEAYAYQLGYQFAIWDDDHLDPLETPWFDSSTGELTPMPIVAGFVSLEGGRASVFTKYRGLGDCGAVADYAVVDDLLHLVRFAERECSLDYDESADDTASWPVVHEAPVGG